MRREMFDSRVRALALLTALPAVFLLALGCDQADGPIDEDVGGGEAIAPEATPAGGAMAAGRGMGKGFRDGHPGRMGRGKPHRSPAAMLLRSALQDLDLSDEQRTQLQALRPEKGAHKGEWRGKGRADFHQALIRALETGELDRAAFSAKLDSKQGEHDEWLAERNERLATLHRILTPDQREQLVNGVRTRLEQKKAEHADKADGDRKGRKGKRGGRGCDGHFCGMLGKLTSGLDLSAEQQAQIDALIAKAKEQRPDADDWAAKHEEKRAEIDAMLDAFAGADFDPAVSAPKPTPMKDPAERMAFKAEQIEALIGILTPEQRQQLAEQLRDRAGKMGRGMKGHGMKDHGGPGRGGFDCPFADDDL